MIGEFLNSEDVIIPKWIEINRIRTYCGEVWPDNPLMARQIADDVFRILTAAHVNRPFFFSGKTEKGILSGLLYYQGKKTKMIRTQKKIARKLGATEMTVRWSYRNWTTEFPEILKPSQVNKTK